MGGGHLYFGLDIIPVKEFSKQTISMYFLGMKIDSKLAYKMGFCTIFSKNTPFFLPILDP